MDEWGRDPSIQRMRKIFSAMEELDRALIKSTDTSPFDTRLRAIRAMSLELFEKSYAHGLSKGVQPDNLFILELFRHCHVTSFTKHGITVHGQDGKENHKIADLIREVSE